MKPCRSNQMLSSFRSKNVSSMWPLGRRGFSAFGSAANRSYNGSNRIRPVSLILSIPLLALGHVAYADISDDDIGLEVEPPSKGKTETLELLEKSIAETSRDRSSGGKFGLFLSEYLIEPVKTGFRFIQLSILFIPLLILYPMTWLGPKVASAQNERSGAVIYYDLLSGAMEYAGPSFIKVGSESNWYDSLSGSAIDQELMLYELTKLSLMVYTSMMMTGMILA